MNELLPCPFCGGEAYTAAKNMPNWTWNWCSVICDGCGAKVTRAGNEGTYQGAEKAAIEAWNTRAERTCRNVHKEWEKTSFAGAQTAFCCSECGAHYVDCECYYAGLADAEEERIRTNYCPNCGARVKN